MGCMQELVPGESVRMRRERRAVEIEGRKGNTERKENSLKSSRQ